MERVPLAALWSRDESQPYDKMAAPVAEGRAAGISPPLGVRREASLTLRGRRWRRSGVGYRHFRPLGAWTPYDNMAALRCLEGGTATSGPE